MSTGIYKRTKEHGEAISRALKGHKTSEETKREIGDANRNQVYFNCFYCGRKSSDKPSHYKKKKRHFCSMKCYALFREEKMPLEEQHAYKGVYQGNKQIYYARYAKKHPERISHLKARRYAREKMLKEATR